MNRKTFNHAVVGWACILLHLAACTPGVELPEVHRDRTLIIMNGGPNQYALFNNQNPYIPGSDQGYHLGTLPAMFEPLIMFNVITGDHENWLAETWEYDDDFRVITITLREGIKWSDGHPLTTSDVAFTFDLLKEHAGSMVHLADLPEFFDRSEVVDERTIRLVLTQPGPAFWATTLSSNHGVHILPEHIWKDVDPLEFSNHDIDAGLPLGTGPYRLVYASPYQKIFDLRPDWWAARTSFKRLPRVERIIYVPQQEESQAAQLLLTDQLDMGFIMQVLTLENVLERNEKVSTFSGSDPPYGYLDWCPIDLSLNCSEAPFDDPRIRRAISLSLDRDKLVQLAESGAGVPALHPFTPYEWFAPFIDPLDEILAAKGYGTHGQSEQVAPIMQGIGYRQDEEGMWIDAEGERVEISMYVPQWLRPYGPPLTQQLREAGFDASFDTSPGLATLVQTGEQKASLGCKGPSGVRGMDPFVMLNVYTSQYYRPTGQPVPLTSTTSRWRNEKYDRIVEQTAPLQVGDPELQRLFLEAMEIWVDEMPDIFLSQLIIRYPLNNSRWTGWPSQDDPYGFPHSWQWELLKTFVRLEPTRDV
ncbi:MAG: ABC transporter substrate-binding protein [Candidatus Latescibacterota bacterium]|nr:ABC transporter substrate-binding protein [Candidatus Latescibacterota bacterium]MEE3040001.1 ABC transporter substrate-binding protein [Candidatus Latescibacterota bacterium]MEE3337298.1 ABC transporter substrate-binding protein [Candidatus Latescibacterota bacterium]